MTVAPEVLLFCGYATALLLLACALDSLARRSDARTGRYRTAGFSYRPEHDAWLCPQGQTLWPTLYDPQKELMRYRAKPSACNACPVKAGCTTSSQGREVTRPTRPWPHSEAARFHRGLVLALVGLAALLLVVTAARHHRPDELAVIAGPLAGSVLLGYRLTAHLRRTPARFPVPPAATPTAPNRSGAAPGAR
jgi:hypothetical protein